MIIFKTPNCKLFYNNFLRCRAVFAGEYAGVYACGQAFQLQRVLRLLASEGCLQHRGTGGVHQPQRAETRPAEIEGYAVLGRVGVGGDGWCGFGRGDSVGWHTVGEMRVVVYYGVVRGIADQHISASIIINCWE